MLLRLDSLTRSARLLSLAGVLALASASDAAWPNRYDGTGHGSDEPVAMAVDGLGNTYVTASSYGPTSDADYLTIKYSPTGQRLWVRRYNGVGNAGDYPADIKVDASGNVYVTGVSTGLSNSDVATLKYDTNGSVVWLKRYNSPVNSHDSGKALLVDPDGVVTIVGSSRNSSGNDDILLVRYNESGTFAWAKRFDGPAKNWDKGIGIVGDGDGGFYVVGSSVGDTSSTDYVTIRYDANGVKIWTRIKNGSGNGSDEPVGIVRDSNFNVIVTGTSIGASFTSDYLTIKYSASGSMQWERRLAIPGNEDIAMALAVDTNNNIAVTGTSGWDIELMDYATVVYDTNGVRRWVRTYTAHDITGGSYDVANSVAFDAVGNVVVSGFTQGDGGPAMDYDYTTLRYSPTGSTMNLWRYEGPSDSDDQGSAMAILPNNRPVVTGRSLGTNNWDILTTRH